LSFPRQAAALATLFAVCLLAADTPEAAGRKALDLLLAEKYTELRALLTPMASDVLTIDFLHDRVGGELRTFGRMNRIGDAVIAQDGDNTMVSFPVHFAVQKINIQITLTPTLKIAGLYLRPSDAPLPKVWRRPAYSHPDAFTQSEVTVGSDEWRLAGTLTMPSGPGPFPGLVLVHGPGPIDRDEQVYSNRIFRDIAEGLSSRNIAVLRYDKRTLTYGDKMGAMAYTIDQETVEDAVRAIALLRTKPRIDPRRVYVLGHSLGGYAAPRIAARDGKLAGLIFLAANARPIEDVALAQNDYVAHLSGDPDPQVRQRLDALKAEVARVKALEPGKPPPQMLLGLPGVYLLDLKGYDPAAQAAKLEIPLLFLQGGRDFQVTSKDFDAWKSALASRRNIEYKQYPALNNLFIAGQGQPGPTDYLQQGNVDPAVIADIAAWIAHSGN
jgi:uncharacterized protein